MKKVTFLLINATLLLSSLNTFSQFANADFTVNYGYLYGSDGSYPNASDDFGGWVSDGSGNAYVYQTNSGFRI